MYGCALLLAFTIAHVDSTGNWPQWRGPKRDDVSSDTGLLTEWPKDGPKLLWETKGAGRGYASLAITGGRIYTMGDKLSETMKALMLPALKKLAANQSGRSSLVQPMTATMKVPVRHRPSMATVFTT